jgi:C-3',4' desaturase CrtD
VICMAQSVIVIGGGIGGLTAGALLAKVGYDVTVLEASREWGGCAGKFKRGPYTFAVGATLGMGFENGGIHDRILRFLDISVKSLLLEKVMYIHMPDQTFIFHRNRNQHVTELQKVFPSYGSNLRAFYQDVYDIASEIRKLMKPLPVLPPTTFKEWFMLFRSLSITSPRLLPYFNQTLSTLLHKHGLADVADFVHLIDAQIIDSMQATNETCSLLLGCLALDIYHEGAFYVEGGLFQVAYSLAQCITEHNGNTKLGRKVVAVEKTEEGWTVRDHRGDMYKAQHVICNVPIGNLQQFLAPTIMSKLPSSFHNKVTTMQWGAFTLYLAIKEEVILPHTPLFQQVLTGKGMSEGEHLFLSLSHPDDRKRAPSGTRTLTVSTHIDLSKWETKDAYDKRKSYMTEKMLENIQCVFPQLHEGIIKIITGAPRAWERFAGRAGVGGFPQSTKHALFQSVSHRTGIPGLWLCGDTIFPGAGTIGVSVSGYHVFRSITNNKYQLP